MSPLPFALLLLLTLLACDTPLATAVVVPADFTARLDGFIRCLLSDSSPVPVNIRTPELAIAVVANNRVILAAGYGNTSHGTPITADTLFGIGSISKAFTSTAAGILADQGRLRLGERISSQAALRTYDAYIDREASLRDLFTHHTGISRNDFLAVFHSTDSDWRAMLAQYVPLLQPSLPFRSEYLYNNWMVAQAALVIESVIDVQWSDYITSMLLHPLGMLNTTTTYKQSLSGNRATPYTAGSSRRDPAVALPAEVDAWVDLIAPAGAIHSTANDMSKWLLLHLGSHPQIINQSTLTMLHSAEVTTTAPTQPFDMRGYATATNPNLSVVTLGYGYNWLEKVWNGHAAIEHSGGLFGFVSDLWFFPMDGFGWWIGVPAVSGMYFDLLAVWIVAEMLGEVNIVDGICISESSVVDNEMRWTEVQETLGPLFDELHARRREHSFVPLHSFDRAASTPPPSKRAADVTALAVDVSHLAGTYTDLVGPFGIITVTLNGNNSTYPLRLTWETAEMLLTPAGGSDPYDYSAVLVGPEAFLQLFEGESLPGVALFDVDSQGAALGMHFYLGSPVPYLTAAAHLPKPFSSSSSSTGGNSSSGVSPAVERDKTVELVVVLCIVSIVLLAVVSYALLITKRYQELKSAGGGGALLSSDQSLRESLMTS